jgi:hypothetical protein
VVAHFSIEIACGERRRLHVKVVMLIRDGSRWSTSDLRIGWVYRETCDILGSTGRFFRGFFFVVVLFAKFLVAGAEELGI